MSKRKRAAKGEEITDDLGVVVSTEGNFSFYSKKDYWANRYARQASSGVQCFEPGESGSGWSARQFGTRCRAGAGIPGAWLRELYTGAASCKFASASCDEIEGKWG
jgi:hypothetical protein